MMVCTPGESMAASWISRRERRESASVLPLDVSGRWMIAKSCCWCRSAQRARFPVGSLMPINLFNACWSVRTKNFRP